MKDFLKKSTEDVINELIEGILVEFSMDFIEELLEGITEGNFLKDPKTVNLLTFNQKCRMGEIQGNHKKS